MISNKPRLFRGCNARSLNPQLYESFKEALAEKTVYDLVHPRDIKFMKDAIELYESKKAYSTLRELVGKVHGYVSLT